MNLVDCHCHLQHPKFDEDREKVIAEAKKKMAFVVVGGANPVWNRSGLELCKKHKGFLFPTLGLHPVEALKLKAKQLDEEFDLIKENKKDIVAIGEVGLDYHWVKEKDRQEKQKEIFRQFIDLSKETKLPVLIHSWDAELDCLKIMEDEGVKGAIMHCFAGKKDAQAEAFRLGYYISISTAIVFSKQAKKLARDTPLDKILLETDAPYLDPNRKRNVPWNTEMAAKRAAQAKKMETEEIIDAVLKNACSAFPNLKR